MSPRRAMQEYDPVPQDNIDWRHRWARRVRQDAQQAMRCLVVVGCVATCVTLHWVR